jgi:hypothetical protein
VIDNNFPPAKEEEILVAVILPNSTLKVLPDENIA